MAKEQVADTADDTNEKTENDIKNELLNYIINNNVEELKRYIENGGGVNYKINGAPLLEYAVLSRNTDITKLLIDGGADVNCLDEINLNPSLIYASSNKNLASMKLLVDGGANINLNDGDGYSILASTLLRTHDKEVIKFLLERGAKIGSKGGEIWRGPEVEKLLTAAGVADDIAEMKKVGLDIKLLEDSELSALIINRVKHLLINNFLPAIHVEKGKVSIKGDNFSDYKNQLANLYKGGLPDKLLSELCSTLNELSFKVDEATSNENENSSLDLSVTTTDYVTEELFKILGDSAVDQDFNS